jgi:hypothetical protein
MNLGKHRTPNIQFLPKCVQPQRTQRTQRKTITWADRPDHLSGENPLFLKFPALRSLRSLRLINCRISTAENAENTEKNNHWEDSQDSPF